MIAPTDLVQLSASRWFMPVLAVMDETGEARFGVLVRRLNISRSALSRCLDSLQTLGWLGRNPGHGHPLRPEYLLTQAGRPLAAWSARVMRERARLGLATPELGRWSLPLLVHLESGWKRFSMIEAELHPISPRSLSMTLKQGLESRLVTRRLEDVFPPLGLYGLTARGRDFAAALH
ncbi:MAG: winged helix-turn-helix transcriptional regulator [Allosphingosinicella sp.]